DRPESVPARAGLRRHEDELSAFDLDDGVEHSHRPASATRLLMRSSAPSRTRTTRLPTASRRSSSPFSSSSTVPSTIGLVPSSRIGQPVHHLPPVSRATVEQSTGPLLFFPVARNFRLVSRCE